MPQRDKELVSALAGPVRHLRRGEDAILEGAPPRAVMLVLDGLVCRYRTLPSGQRQNTAYMIPGDLCDLHVFILSQMDHSIGALTDAHIKEIPESAVVAMLSRPLLARALLKSTLVDEATLREWIVNIARRSAAEAIGHLFCELYERMNAVGLVVDRGFSLPLTQEMIGDTVGLSVVHVNRSLQLLRTEGLIEFAAGLLRLPDLARLKLFSGFEERYLHLSIRPAL